MLIEIPDRLVSRIVLLQGCTDGGCLIRRPKGMHTNGGCKCRDRLGALGRPDKQAVAMVIGCVIAAGDDQGDRPDVGGE